MSEALNIIKDPTLTYNQELYALAKLGENTDDTIRYSDEYYKAKKISGLKSKDFRPLRVNMQLFPLDVACTETYPKVLVYDDNGNALYTNYLYYYKFICQF